jgi:membrane fusion protein, copper/silver efflux system
MQAREMVDQGKTWLRTRRQGWAALGKAALLIGIGFLAAWLLLPSGPRGASLDEAEGHGTAQDRSIRQMWTCSMHPQIQRPGPGKCPICGMDLIPVAGGTAALTSLRQLELSPAARELMNIRVWPVERRFVTTQVRMAGKVEYDETRQKHITAWIPGRLDRLYVDYTGVEVRQGDHMVYIYSPELYSAQQGLIQAIRSGQARAPEGRRQLTGVDLVESSREKLRLLGLADTQISQIEKQESPSSHLTIQAPSGGIVIEKLKQQGDYVKTGERIYTVADLSHVWVQLDAYESDLVWLRYGQEAAFTTEAYPGETFRGRVAFIDPILDDRKRTVKIRVNVSNPEGKLKPNMFVRGIAQAEIASGGNVIDADLAGKWISPMHPEIVKDRPGKCDVCGMPLVRAESLGYVSSESLQTAPPLVIPASAVLWTGTRAVVYVEVPETAQPTYEGREIVLGARAGDHYLVRSGLREGQLVVTHGSFKIDSALQIQAKPSMMTPEGGGGGGEHDHGAASPSAAQPAGETVVQAPAEFLAQLQQVDAASRDLLGAAVGTDLERKHEAFKRLGAAVDAVNMDLVRGHTAMLWKEFRMLLGNDAVEGQQAVDADAAGRVARKTARTMERVRKQLMAPQQEHAGHAGAAAERLEVPAAFAEQIADLLRGYFTLHEALAGDDLPAARQAAGQLRSAAEGVSGEGLSEPARHAWQKEKADLGTILDAMQADEALAPLRLTFSQLSGEMEALVHRFGAGPASPVYRVHCPMALGNQGAWWLQQTVEVRNPYFGSTMLKCHDRLEQIAGAGGPAPEEHVHD